MVLYSRVDGKILSSKHKGKNCLTESELDQQLLWLSKECPTASGFLAVKKKMFGRQLLNSLHLILFPGTLKEISEKIFCDFNFSKGNFISKRMCLCKCKHVVG